VPHDDRTAAAEQRDWDDLSRRLRIGAAQLELPIEDAQARQLLAYIAHLDRWNGVHSLSAWKNPSDFLVHHVFDSMTLVNPLGRFARGRPLHVLDAGSGPGFPAAVLATMRPDWSVVAVDAVGKKVAFVRQAAAEAGIPNLVGLHARLEDLVRPTPFDIVVSRAFGSLDSLAKQTSHLLAPEGIWVAQKGRVPKEEMARLRGDFQVFHVEHVTVPELDVERHLVWMCRINR
jgi:16S rRNA (guanine527-N7)-methyltransferase